MAKDREKIEDKANNEPVANCDQLPMAADIQPMIRVIRGQQVIIDRDLALLYGVETRALNQAVKRNIDMRAFVSMRRFIATNAQYPPVRIERFNKAHDRFLLIDDEVYHIGASIKDLGKKWFGFTLMRDIPVSEIINRIKD